MATSKGNPQSPKVAIYARVSTANGHQDPEMQTRELRQYAAARGWHVAGEYIDCGISGSIESRPELNRLMNDARKRRFDIVACWRFDRFARSTKHLLLALEEFRALGIQFISYQENIDTTSPLGQALFTIVGAVAQLERDLIRERVRAGLRNARAKGSTLGRPRVAVDAARIALLRAQGHSWEAIGRELGIGEGTVRRAAQTSAKIVSETASLIPVCSASVCDTEQQSQTLVCGVAVSLRFDPRAQDGDRGRNHHRLSGLI